jgi:hypothetical protein
LRPFASPLSLFEQPANKVFNVGERVLRGLMIKRVIAILVIATASFVINPSLLSGASPVFGSSLEKNVPA